jgi:hypothetical protein
MVRSNATPRLGWHAIVGAHVTTNAPVATPTAGLAGSNRDVEFGV